LRVERKVDTLSIGFKEESGKLIKLLVGSKMVLGFREELFVYPVGESRPATPRSFELGSLGSWGRGTSILHAKTDGIPMTEKHYTVEMEGALFETDIPEQHMWQPKSAKYKVLWRKRLEKTVR
jgi:hypothetical protein